MIAPPHRHHTQTSRRVANRSNRTGGFSKAYHGRTARTGSGLYDTDHENSHKGGYFRWSVSTCLAGIVGALTIMIVISGSIQKEDIDTRVLPAIGNFQNKSDVLSLNTSLKSGTQISWAIPKADRLEAITGAISTRHITYETTTQRRNGRPYISTKPYLRIVSRLTSVPQPYTQYIPKFNPIKLYANTDQIDSNSFSSQSPSPTGSALVQVVSLPGGVLPNEDNQEIDNTEAIELVKEARRDNDLASRYSQEALSKEKHTTTTGSLLEKPDGQEEDITPSQLTQTTLLAKTIVNSDFLTDELEGAQRRVVALGTDQDLIGLLISNGSQVWQAESVKNSAHSFLPGNILKAGQEIHLTLLPSLTKSETLELAKFSVFSPGHKHIVTVKRSGSGDYVASSSPEEAETTLAVLSPEKNKTSNLYASIYHAALAQNIPPIQIVKILKIHAYQIDFRRRTSPDDTLELLFSFDGDQAIDSSPGELLYSRITAGKHISQFYRFRTFDNQIDHFDKNGNNGKKFLIRRPILSNNVRLTSGFGMRYHPILKKKRMHNGTDWSAQPGTPIVSSGDGVIEYVGRRKQYGNYIRIRHANGYQTAYAHMSRFARGVRVGTKIKQGQIIGYVGSTGLSTGPHLHFEVLVNKEFVNPMSIHIPRQHQLKGRELFEYRKEKSRIDALRRSAPVLTAKE